MSDFSAPVVGRVLRANTVGFTCGTNSSALDLPSFGAFVTTYSPAAQDASPIGLIYGIQIDDDPLVRQLVLANRLNTSTVRDQRENRLVPVEISVITVGYQIGSDVYHGLPPRPPISLEPVFLCEEPTIVAFTESSEFLRLVLNASEVPSEELIGAVLRQAASARPENERRPYLVTAGRRLAQLLSGDLARLDHILRLIRP